MMIQDVIIIYAALGISWGAMNTYHAISAISTGNVGSWFGSDSQTLSRMQDSVDRLRSKMLEIPLWASSAVVAFMLLIMFASLSAIWPFSVYKHFKKGN